MEENGSDAPDMAVYNYTYFDRHIATGGHAKNEAFLARYTAAKVNRSRGARVRYETEQLEFRQVDQEAFNRGLLRNGPRAVTEFNDAMKLMGQQD